MGAHAALNVEQPITDRREAGDRRNLPGHVGTTQLRGKKHPIAVDVHVMALCFDLDIELTQLSGSESPPLLLPHPLLEKARKSPPGKAPPNRGGVGPTVFATARAVLVFPRSGRSVERDHGAGGRPVGHVCTTVRSSSKSQKCGKLTSATSAPSISIRLPASAPRTPNAMAMRWS